MIGVAVEKDKVILHLSSGQRDAMLSVHNAYRLSDMMSIAAQHASAYVPNISEGGIIVPKLSVPQRWRAKVESYDGFVAIRFYAPEPGPIKKVPLPPDMAVHMAGLIRFKAQQATYKMRFEFKNGSGIAQPKPQPKRRTLKDIQTKETLSGLRRKLIH